MANSLGAVSGSTSPYQTGSYTVESNDKNTLTMTGYFQLLATQLQNQDMMNPMDNSELMAQMTQMAMVQSMTSMTDAMKNSTAVTTQTYAASLVGQRVTMAVTEENSYGQETPVDVKYGTVEWVNFTSGDPTIKIKDDPKEYSLTHLVGMGEIPNPFKNQTGESSGTDTDTDNDTDNGPGNTENTTRMASRAASYSSGKPTAGYTDSSDSVKRTKASSDSGLTSLAASMAVGANLSAEDITRIKEGREEIRELARSGAYSSPEEIPDLTIRR